MENVTLGYAKRPELTNGNLESNQALEVKKGDTLKIYKYNEATVNGIHAYDSIETCTVLAIRKSKDGRRVKIQNLDLNYECTLLIDKSQCKIEIIKEVPVVEEIEVIETIEQPTTTSLVEEFKTESETIINSINTESLETQKTSFEAVDAQLDKIYQAIEENINNEEIRLQLRDIENDLKWHYSSLHELIEEQTMPDCADFNNITNLKDIYITNWNKLPQEIQKYILGCDKYWIDLQEILIYKDNTIVASIGISGHHKHDIEINSIGAGNKGELFQWTLYKGYTLNNLEVSAEKQELIQENKTKVTHNEYENIAKELASRIYAKDETKITMKEYDKLLDNYEILPFQINTDNEELKKIINLYADNETIEADRIIYRGSIDKSVLYELYQNKGYNDLYYEYYQVIICKDELKTILTYCEGDFIAEVYNTIEDYNKGIERTKKFIEEM